MLASSASNLNQNRFSAWMKQLDIRVKVLTMFCLSISLIFLKNPYALAWLGTLTMIALLCMQRYRTTLTLYGFLLIGWLLSFAFSRLLAQYIPAMQNQGLIQTMIPFLRMWPLINLSLAIALTLEVGSALKSLKQMRLPRIIYLPLMVALRFIPGFINDIKQLRDCLTIRGIPLTPWKLLIHPRRTLRLLFVPLVIRALRLADELAIAAELKQVGYGAGPQTAKAQLRWCDSTFLAVTMLAIVAAWQLPGANVHNAGDIKQIQHQTQQSTAEEPS